MVGYDGHDFFALLGFVACIAHALTPFFGHRVRLSAMQHAEIKVLLVRQMPHTGDEGVRK